jgi:hypothetical protein
MKYTATWSESASNREVAIDEYVDLLKVLDQIGSRPDPATLLEVYENDTRRAIGIGLGKDRTIVTYQDSLDPPYFISIGNSQEEGVETFLYGGEPTEYLAANLVTLARGYGALREFFESGTRPTACSWEQL